MGTAACLDVPVTDELAADGNPLSWGGPWDASAVTDSETEAVPVCDVAASTAGWGDADPMATPITYVDHDSFDDPVALREALRPLPLSETSAVPSRRSQAARDLPPYLEGLYRIPLLTREQEIHLFRQMNALKFLAERARREGAEGRVRDLLKRASEVRQRILRANQRLVVSIAKRFAGRQDDLFELISDANLPLIEAVERFDFARGYRFSTYATWAIRNGLIRSVATERRRRERFVLGMEEVFEGVPDHRGEPRESTGVVRNIGATVRGLLMRLNDRERLVMQGRYGLDGARQLSLRQIGTQLGVSKERARQIEIAAREKLRKFAAASASLEALPA